MQFKNIVHVLFYVSLLTLTSHLNARLGGFSNKIKKGTILAAPMPPIPTPLNAHPHHTVQQKLSNPMPMPQHPQQHLAITPEYLARQSGISDQDLQTLTKQNRYLRDQISFLEKESYRLQQQNRNLVIDKQNLKKKKQKLMRQLVAQQDRY